MRITNRHKLTIVSHKNQKQFNVAIMKFKNLSIYVQRKIDIIFRAYRAFVKTYVDNVVVFNHTLKKHFNHLHIIFVLFESFDITLSSKKFFLDYSTVTLFDQKINAFELTTAKNKFKIIFELNFLYILKNLKGYLNFID